MQKSVIRRRVLDKRNAMSQAEISKKSAKITASLQALELFENAQSILFYYSVQSEASTLESLSQFAPKKSLYLPRLIDETTLIPLSFISAGELAVNRYGIPEPKMLNESVIRPKLDLIIVPGVAFDRQGNRIGMGKGYYDRFLAGYEGVTKIALAYSEQILESIPKEPYDIAIDFIVTENEVIRCKS